MRTKWVIAVLTVALGGPASFAQDAKKDDKKDPKPAEKKDDKADSKAKAVAAELEATRPGDKQQQEVYKLQAKTNDEIDALKAKIEDLKEKLQKDRLAVLTADQKKRLEDILKEKAGTDKKDK